MTECDKIITKFSELLTKSEERVSIFSKTMSDCTQMIDNLTNEYTTQLDKLQKSRDELLIQNKILIENSRKDKEMYDKLSNKHEKLVDELINMSRFKHSASENNININ